LYGIEVREHGAVTMVELRGELDLYSLGELRENLNRALGPRRSVLVDLSGITFLDLECARELAVRSQLDADRLTLRNPSPHVQASVEAFGMEGWIRLYPGADREEPPVVSEAPS